MDPRKPHFYKLILKEGIRYNILRFPTKFIMKYGVEISSEVNLRIPDGRTFVVEVAKFEDHNVCLVKEGWKQFTDHYSLKPCQVLLFQYEGDSSFGVFIFDKSATEIDYPNLTTCHHEKGPNSNKQEEEAKDANQIPADDDEGDHQEPNKEDDAVKNDGDLAELGTFKKLTLIDDEGDHEEPIKEKEGDQDDNSVEAVHQINDQAPADEELNEEEQGKEAETLCQTDLLDKGSDEEANMEEEANKDDNTAETFNIDQTDPLDEEGNKEEANKDDNSAETLNQTPPEWNLDKENEFVEHTTSDYVLNHTPLELKTTKKNHLRRLHKKRRRRTTSEKEEEDEMSNQNPPDSRKERKYLLRKRNGKTPSDKEQDEDEDNSSHESLEEEDDDEDSDEIFSLEEEESEDSDETFSLEEEESDEIFSLEKEDEDTSVLNQTREEPSRKKRGRPRKEHKKTTSKKKSDTNDHFEEVSSYEVGAKTNSTALQRACAYKPDNPSFYVEMQPSYLNPGRKLVVPVDFITNHLLNKTGNITLCSLDGKTWHARYLRYKTHNKYTKAVIYDGWRDFRKDNKLKLGDVCVFELTDPTDIKLTVIIYRFMEDSSSGGMNSSAKERSKNDNEQQPLASHEKAIALQKAKGFKSKNPYFTMVMQPAYLGNRWRLYVPYKFIKRNLDENKSQVILQLPDGKSWVVDFYILSVASGQKKAQFIGINWKKFAQYAKLEVGTVCLFELIDPSEAIFKVFIY